MALEFISYARCVSIMLTSSSTTLTFEASTEALRREAHAVLAGRAGLRRTARGGLDQQVFTERLQAGRIHEVRELQLAHLHRRGLSRDAHADHAVAADRDALRALGNA